MYLIIVIAIVLAYFLYSFITDKFSSIHAIPGPKPYLFLGHLPYFIKAPDTFKLMEKWANDFSQYSMFKINLFVGDAKWYVVMKNPEFAKTVLSKPELFVRSQFLPKYLPMIGNGLLSATGDEHRWQKKFFSKAFSMSQMKYYIPVFSKHAKKLVTVFNEFVVDEQEGNNIDVGKYFANMTLDAIGEISFGYNFNAQTTSNNPLAESFKKMCVGVLDGRARLLLTLFPFLWYAPFGPAQIIKRYQKELNDIVDLVLKERVVKLKENRLTETEENDLLNLMIKEKESSGHFTEKLIRDSSFTFLFAGNETTAKALPGILLFLAKYPDLQEKVRDEINNCIQVADDVTDNELNQLIYADAFIKESLRLYVPVPQNGRICNVDYKFDEFILPKGTGIILPNYIFHESKDYDDAKTFNPERFINENIRHGTDFTFGYGPFSCIGKRFAIEEMKVTLVHLLKTFRVCIDKENEKYDRKVRLTINVSPNHLIRLKKI